MLMTDDQKDKTSGENDANVIEDETELIGMTRPEMVDMARRFMMMPKIRQTPLVQQKRFLLQKGLREDEINEAMKGLPLQQNMWHISNTAMDHAVVPGSSYDFTTRSWGVSNLLRITKYAMIITGFSYASWHLLRSYVLPRFFNIPEPVEKRIHVIEGKVDEMQGMMQDVTTELLLKLQTLIDKQSVTDRFSFQSASQLDDIQKGIENITTMFVGKDQLPPTRALARKRTAITSRVFLRTEDPSGSDKSRNERSGEGSTLTPATAKTLAPAAAPTEVSAPAQASTPTEAPAPAEKHNGSTPAGKNVSGGDS